MLQGGGALGAYQAGAYDGSGRSRATCRAGSPAFPSAPSTRPSSPAIRLSAASSDCASSGKQCPAASSAGLSANDDNSRKLFNETSAAMAALRRRARLLRAARSAGGSHAARHAGSDQHLRFRSALRHAERAGRFRSAQLRRGALERRRRRGAAPATCDISTRTSQTIGPEHIMASGALPPGFPPIDDRRQALLGRRPRLQHAAAIRARTRWATSRHGASFRSICSAPAATCRRPCSMSASARRRSAIRAVPGSTPISFARSKPCGGPSSILRPNVPAELGDNPDWRLLDSLAATRPSPSCSSSTGARPIGRNRTITSSRAIPWRNIGAPDATTSSTRSTIPPGRTAQPPEEGVTVLDLTRDIDSRHDRNASL